MKIAIALYFRAPLGGRQDNVHATAANLLRNNHEVMVFCPGGPFQAILKKDGIPVAELRGGDGLSFDLVHAHPGESRVFGQRLARRLRIPLFMTFHGRWIDGIASYRHGCANILAVSLAVRDNIVAVAPEAAGRVEIMPNAVDLAQIVPSGRRSEADGGFRVLVASRFDVDKKRLVETLTALWEEQAGRGITTISWDLAGDGTMVPDMRLASGRIFGEAAPIRFHGWLDKPALASLFDATDVSAGGGADRLPAGRGERRPRAADGFQAAAAREARGGDAGRGPAPAGRPRHRSRGAAASGSGAGDGMFGPGTGVRVYLACGATDMRKGIDGLAARAQEVLRQDPCSGAVFAFRGRRGDRLKLLTWDGQGFCLYYKLLERGRFPWPSPADGVARLTAAQLAMLWEGIDWRRPAWSAPPGRVA